MLTPKPDFYDVTINGHFSALVGLPPVHRDHEPLAIIAHGRDSSARSPHIEKIYNAYLDLGFRVVVPNLRNSDWNDSPGCKKDFTIAAHVDDTRATIEWARMEFGYDCFAMAGHSMGGFSTCYLAATEYRDQTSHILAVSPFTSGVRAILARQNSDNHPDGLENMDREMPAALEEWPQWSIYPYIENLTMPVSVIAGGADTITTPQDMEFFAGGLPLCVDYRIVEGAKHLMEDGQEEFDYTELIRRLEGHKLHR